MLLLTMVTVSLLHQTKAGCPFQNPFYFVDRPSVVTVVDSEGLMVADRVRVSWGRLENFKCVDYFQIEYYVKDDMANTVKLSDRINRHRRSHDIDIKPCTDYLFKVIASEDWNGMREDFKMASDTISFRVDYAPRFKRPPRVIERKIRLPRPTRPRRSKRGVTEPTVWAREKRAPLLEEVGQVPTTPGEPEPDLPFNILVQWRLNDIDWPMCLDYFEFDYYDIVYNESVFMQTFSRPFLEQQMEFELLNTKVPCSHEYAFITRVFGLTGDFSLSTWTPPSCIMTTPEPTTTTTVATTIQEEGALERAQEENYRLKEKISGLKQQYGPIGNQVYQALKEQVFLGFEGYLARKKILEGGDIGQIQKLAENPDAPF